MFSACRWRALSGILLIWPATMSMALAAHTDPSGRVARLNHSQGEISYSPAGEDEWVGAARNRPLIHGDRLRTDRDARAELQAGSAAIRLGPDTGVEILNLDDRIAQLRLTQGTISLSVRRLAQGQSYEVDTPMLAFVVSRAGRYRIDVDPHRDQVTIVIWEGGGEAYGDGSSFPLRTGDAVRFHDTDLRDYDMYGLPRADVFDRYCLDRDQRLDRSESLRYLDDDVVGYQDLDSYGSWRDVRGLGQVWFPHRVDADWAPYRAGHWVWQEPWGWTWVDDAPWGFAPSHYGRWVSAANRWGWVPGPRNVRPVYAPALVAFVGGRGRSVSLALGDSSPIGWFPLGPRETYVPSYQVSRDYFTRVNVSNTVIDNTTINNVYNHYSSGDINVTQVSYANRSVAGAVTAVPSAVFVNADPVRQAAIRLDRNALTGGNITRVAPVAPSVRSVLGAGASATVRPSREASGRRVIARSAPARTERPFAVREPQLQRNPGRALEPGPTEPAPGRDSSTRPNVRVIAEQPGAVNARAAGSRRADAKPGAGSAKADSLEPLKRPEKAGQDAGRQALAESRRQEQQQRKDEREQRAIDKEQAKHQRRSELQQQEDQRRAECERLAIYQQQDVERCRPERAAQWRDGQDLKDKDNSQ